MSSRAQDWIKRLRLEPHREGGYFRETYRSGSSTAIYFLLERGQISALHRIKSDEAWHFYDGSPLEVHVIDPDGHHRVEDVGPDRPQAVVPARSWFGARLKGAGAFALVGCTVAPPFEFADFELGDRAKLISQFPKHRDMITSLTHGC